MLIYLHEYKKITQIYLKIKEDDFIEIMATCHKNCRFQGHSQTQTLMTEYTAETSKKDIQILNIILIYVHAYIK